MSSFWRLCPTLLCRHRPKSLAMLHEGLEYAGSSSVCQGVHRLIVVFFVLVSAGILVPGQARVRGCVRQVVHRLVVVFFRLRRLVAVLLQHPRPRHRVCPPPRRPPTNASRLIVVGFCSAFANNVPLAPGVANMPCEQFCLKYESCDFCCLAKLTSNSSPRSG